MFDRPYEYNYEPILPEPEVIVHEEVKVHHLGVNSPYMGEDLGDNDDQLVRPASVGLVSLSHSQIYAKHDKDHIGKVNISFLINPSLAHSFMSRVHVFSYPWTIRRTLRATPWMIVVLCG